MALSKYIIRGAMIFGAIFIVVGLLSVYYVINTSQANLQEIEDRRAEYIENDFEIIRTMDQTTETVIELIQVQTDHMLNAILGQDPEIGDISENLHIQIADLYEDATQLLQEREDLNYNLDNLEPGIFQSSLLWLDEPETENIIDTSNSSAFQRLSSYLSSTSFQLSIYASRGETLVEDFLPELQTLNNSKIDMQGNYSEYQGAYSDLIQSLSQNTNDTYKNIVYSHLVNITEPLDLANSAWSNLMYSLNTDMPNTNFRSHFNTTFQDNVDTYLIPINATLNSLFNETLEADDNATLHLMQDTIVNNYLPTMFNSLEPIDEMVGAANEASTLFEELYPEYLESSQETLFRVEDIIDEENDEFIGTINQFRDQLTDRINSLTLIVFAIIVTFTALFFTFFIIVFSTGFTRILNKNQKLAEGNLKIKTRESYGSNEIGIMERSVDQLAKELQSVLPTVRSTAETLAGISEELAAGSEEAAASISDVASTIRDFSEGSSEQNIILNRVRDSMMEHLDVIERTSNQIAETSDFVLKVAKRTNILGLNASIEAAKAGRYGRGFNVVAEEVRNLSDETKESANQISNMIEDIEFNIRKTVQDILDEVNIVRTVAENTAAGSEEASASTSEQVIMMNEISETSANLSELSQTLNEIMQKFKV